MSNPVALYRKYRSRSFDELVGQDHIKETLKNAIESGSVSHAYLFTGPHGVGKTSTARIFAHAINKVEFTNEGTNYLDIIEIDAASNRRIEEIRNLRETIHVAPTQLKYKIYIIDEVHMLTKEAFNALLKTLEEPPAHAVFILATTEAHKLPATIISRTQRHTFRPVQHSAAIEHVKHVANKEKIKIEDEAVEIIAQQGNGSFRDILSLLDQAANTTNKHITKASVLDMLGLIEEDSIQNLAAAIANSDIRTAFSLLEEFYMQGTTAQSIAQQLLSYWRSQLKNSVNSVSIEAMQEIMKVIESRNSDIALEVALAKLTTKDQPAKTDKETASKTNIHKKKPRKQTTVQKNETQKESVENKATDTPRTRLNSSEISIESKWNEIIELARGKSHSLFSSLRQAKPQATGTGVEFIFRFPLHKKKVLQPHVKSDFEDVLTEVLGGVPDYECVVQGSVDVTQSQSTDSTKEDSSIKKVTDILGGGDIIQLEST